MFRKPVIHILVMTLFLSFIGVPSVAAKTKEEKVAELASKVKREIARLGTGRDAQVNVKLRNKTKLSGYVSKISEEAFFVTEAKTGTETEVPYPTVTQVKGNNLNTGAIIAISAGAAIGIFLVIAYALRD